MMSRKIGSALAAICAVGMFAGCSTGPSDEPGESTQPGSAEVSGEIRFATWWSYVDQSIIDGFNEQYPDVTVKLEYTAVDGYETKIQTQASSNDLPDVFALQGATAAGLEAAGHLLDLTTALETEAWQTSSSWRDTFSKALLDQVDATWTSDDDVSLALPFNATSVAVAYNADIFAEVGIEPATTYEELLDNCRTLSASDYIPMSLTGANWINWWPNLAWDQAFRGKDKASFSPDDPEFLRGFEIVHELADAGCWRESQVSADIATEQSLFLQGRTAQLVTVPESFLKTLADDADFTIGTSRLPGLGDETPVHTLGGGTSNMLAVSANGQNNVAAIAFAKYLTSEGVQAQLAATEYTIPSLDIDVTTSNELMQAYIDAAGDGFLVLPMPGWTQEGGTELINSVLPALILGRMSPAEAVDASRGLLNE